MGLINSQWDRDDNLIMERIQPGIPGKKWFGGKKLSLNLQNEEVAYLYRLGEYESILTPAGNPHKIGGEFELYMIRRGPFELKLSTFPISISDCDVECILIVECIIPEDDLDMFRFICESRQMLDMEQLAGDLKKWVTAGISPVISPYSFQELSEHSANEILSVQDVLTTVFSRMSLRVMRVAEIKYMNAVKEKEQFLQKKEEEFRINRRMRERLSAEKLSRIKDEQRLKDEIQSLLLEARERDLIRQEEVDKLREKMWESAKRRELIRKNILEKEELKHRLEIKKIEIEFNKTILQEERERELAHLEKKLNLERDHIDEKYKMYEKIKKTVNAINEGKISELENQLTHIAHELKTIPEDFAESLKQTVTNATEHFTSVLDDVVRTRLAGDIWDLKKTILDGERTVKPFRMMVWTIDKNGEPVKSATVRPGDRFECFLQTTQPGYLMLVDFPSGGGEPKLLVPNKECNDNYLYSNRSYSIYEFLPVKDDPNAHFRFSDTTEPGVERIFAIITPGKTDPKQFFPNIKPVRNLMDGGTKIDTGDYISGITGARELIISSNGDPGRAVIFSEDYLEFIIE